MFSDETFVSLCIAEAFQKQAILVIGDIMLDRYIWGKVSRISPEAPVPVMQLESETIAVGGAANVARNLATLAAQSIVVGLVGQDDAGETLLAELDKNSIATKHIVRTSRRTTVKTRVVGGHQHIVRIDAEDATPLDVQQEETVMAAIRAAFKEWQLGAVILSDYGKGVISERVSQYAITEATQRGVPILVDPKGSDYTKYRNATTLCPNRSELNQVTGGSARNLDEMLAQGAELKNRLGLKFLVVTLSEMGIALLDPHAELFPAQTHEVFDVSGAGDTVIATLAVAMASGLAARDAVVLANIAAGIVVGKIGTMPILADELAAKIESLENRKQSSRSVYTRQNLMEEVLQWKKLGERVVFTNGCFDLIHIGHVRLLEQAKAIGTKLIVAINSDASVKRLKGAERPIVSERDRAEILAHLSSVDAVIIFEEDTPLETIQALRPQVLVKGSDYAESGVVGGEEVKGWGGRVQLIPLVEGFSTTKTVKRINQASRLEAKDATVKVKE